MHNHTIPVAGDTVISNSLDFIDPFAPTVVSDCGAVASRLMCKAKKNAALPIEQFWQDMAGQMLTGLIMHVVCGGFPENERTLSKVEELLSVSDDELKATIKDIFDMGYCNGASSTIVGALVYMYMTEPTFGGVKSAAKDALYLNRSQG